jgi:hypothetical protein
MRDLAPEIHRQQLVVEGLVTAPICVQMLDLPGAVPASYLGSLVGVPVYRHVRDLHRPHLSPFADVHQQVFRGRGLLAMDPRGCRPRAFEREAA